MAIGFVDGTFCDNRLCAAITTGTSTSSDEDSESATAVGAFPFAAAFAQSPASSTATEHRARLLQALEAATADHSSHRRLPSADATVQRRLVASASVLSLGEQVGFDGRKRQFDHDMDEVGKGKGEDEARQPNVDEFIVSKVDAFTNASSVQQHEQRVHQVRQEGQVGQGIEQGPREERRDRTAAT